MKWLGRNISCVHLTVTWSLKRMNTFDEGLEFLVLNAPSLQVNLEWQEQRE